MATAPALERALLSAAGAPGLVALDVRDMGFMDPPGSSS